FGAEEEPRAQFDEHFAERPLAEAMQPRHGTLKPNIVEIDDLRLRYRPGCPIFIGVGVFDFESAVSLAGAALSSFYVGAHLKRPPQLAPSADQSETTEC